MSNQWVTWAWSQPMRDPSAKLVLVCLADHAGHDGIAWPGSARLGEMTGLNERSVRRWLDEFEEAGLMRRTRRRRANGTLGTYEYQLDHRTPTSGGPPDTDDRNHRTPTSGRPPDTHVRAEPSVTEPPCEPTHEVDPPGSTASFDRFWSYYPRRVGKEKARKAFTAMVRRGEVEEARTGIVVWVRFWREANTGSQYIPWPGTWLNERRYLEPPEPIVADPRRAAVDAWAQVAETMRSVGLYNDRQPFEDTDIEQAVRSVGWSNLCRLTVEEAKIAFTSALVGIKRADPRAG